MSLNRTDLRMLTQVIDAVINKAEPRPDVSRTYTEKELDDLRQRVCVAFAELGPEWGAKVFEWRIPIIRVFVASRGKNKGKPKNKKCVPTMNDLVNMNIWMKQEVREWLEQHLLEALKEWPGAVIQDSPRPRAVRITRYSKMPPDELSCDAIGGKTPIDVMVTAGVLPAGDDQKHLHREPIWFPGPNKGGELLVQVFELKGIT